MKKFTRITLVIFMVFIITIFIPQSKAQAVTASFKYSIDFVRYNSNTKSVEIQGWTLSQNGIESVSVVIDGKKYPLNINRYRPDVYNAYPQYNNRNSGFSKTIPLTITDKMSSRVWIEIKEKNSVPLSIYTENNIPFKKLKYCVDSVKYNFLKKTVDISGWAISGPGIQSVTVIMNGHRYITPQNVYRPDVYNAFPQYNNKYSGFSISIPTTDEIVGPASVLFIENSGDATRNEFPVSYAINKSGKGYWNYDLANKVATKLYRGGNGMGDTNSTDFWSASLLTNCRSLFRQFVSDSISASMYKAKMLTLSGKNSNGITTYVKGVDVAKFETRSNDPATIAYSTNFRQLNEFVNVKIYHDNLRNVNIVYITAATIGH